MKQSAKRLFGVLLCLALVLGLFPGAAFAAQDGEESTVPVEVTMVSNLEPGTEYTDTGYYDDGWFLEDSREENIHLTVISAMAGGASYSSAADDKGGKITALLEDLGFGDIALNDYYSQPVTTEESMGCAIGSKTIRDEDETEYTLLAVMPRNAGYRDEWYGNFRLGESGIHAGFKAARDEMLRFLKQYIQEEEITGPVKIWCAGYSRGAAAAGLLGGFLVDAPDYLGEDVSFSPEDLFVYTIGAPRSIVLEAERAQVLNVAGSRGEDPWDTEGEAYAYGGSGEETFDPEAMEYHCIHNYVAYGDYMTLLPPVSWGYTRYGETIYIDFGSEEMLDKLQSIDPKAAERCVSGDEEVPQRTFDLRTLYTVDADCAPVSLDGLVRTRLQTLSAMLGGRTGFVQGDCGTVLASAAVLAERFGSDLAALFSSKKTEMTKPLAKAGALNILASVMEQMGLDDETGEQDADAVAELLMQAMELAGKTVGDHGTYTAQQFLSDVLRYVFWDQEAQTRLDAVAPMILPLIPEEYQGYVDLYRSLTVYAVANDTEPAALKTADDALALITGFVMENREDPRIQTLVETLLALVPEEQQGNMNIVLMSVPGGASDPVDGFFALLRYCAEGIPDSDMTAEEFRMNITALICALAFPGKDHLQALLNNTEEVLLRDVVSDVLALALKQEDDAPPAGILPLADAALAELTELVDIEDAAGLLEVLTADPAILRGAVTALLFAPENGFSLEDDVRNAMTLAERFPALAQIHFHELYISWLKAQDVLYDPANGEPDLPDIPDYPIYPGTGAASSTPVPEKETTVELPVGEEIPGSVTADDPAAEAGDTVTLTVTPDEDCRTAGVVVLDGEGKIVPVTKNEDGTYSFTMPQGKVSVLPVFTKRGEQPEGLGVNEAVSIEGFADLERNDPHEEGIRFCVEHGLMNGVSETSFAPKDTANRAMAVMMLWRLEGEKEGEPAGFGDVAPDAWYAGAVNWAAASGALKGTSATTFSPDLTITREQIATILYRYAVAKGWGFAVEWDQPLPFGDADQISDYAREAMRWMAVNGIMGSWSEENVDPAAEITRGEIASVFQRFCAWMTRED
jgi:hypothetical protein